MRHPNEPNESDSFLCNWLHVWLWQELGASTLHHLGNRNCSQPLCMCTLGNRRGHIHPCRQNNLPKSLPSPCYMSRHRYHRCVCVCGCHDDLVSHSQGYLLTKQCQSFKLTHFQFHKAKAVLSFPPLLSFCITHLCSLLYFTQLGYAKTYCNMLRPPLSHFLCRMSVGTSTSNITLSTRGTALHCNLLWLMCVYMCLFKKTCKPVMLLR